MHGPDELEDRLAPGLDSMLADTNPSRTGRRLLKRLLYSQLALRDAVLILLGKVHPNLSFTVLAEPPSVYINFTIRRGM